MSTARHQATTWSYVAFAGLICLPGAHAHEIGTTRVVAEMSDGGTYSIAMTTDADTLLNRLQAARGLVPSTPSTIFDFQHQFDELCDETPRHVTFAFDGIPSSPRVVCDVEHAAADTDLSLAPPGVTVTFSGTAAPGAATFTWRSGLTYTSYALTLRSTSQHASAGSERTVWLEGDDESGPLSWAAPPPSRRDVAFTYFGLGFTHILPKGTDHILFVLGIFLLSRRLKPMLWQVSAFTLAHSITLGLTLYGVIALPSSTVEPLIAVSIVYVAVENLVRPRLTSWRVALVFAFGLLHGMGFAGVLGELALPRAEFLTGLLAFNTGVEAGQLAVILAAFLLIGRWASHSDGYRRFIVVPGSTAIALVGLFWTMQRLTT